MQSKTHLQRMMAIKNMMSIFSS